MKRILAVFMIAVLLGSFCEAPVKAAEKKPLVLSLEGTLQSMTHVNLRLSLDERIGTIDLTLHYNPEVLEWFPTPIIQMMPTPSIKPLSEGLLRVTLDCRKYSRHWESIISASFRTRNGGDPQIYLTEAKVYDKNGKEMPLRIENVFENAEIISDITWRYAEDEECLYIGGEGIICDYFYYDDDTRKSEVKTPWHDVGSKAKKAVIQEGITEVDQATFDGFTQLECIEIADSVVKLSEFMLDDDMKERVILRGKAPGPVELYSNIGVQFEPTNEVLRGDLDDDGQLTAEDALGILQEAAQLKPKHRCTGDYNMDGQVTAEDALRVLQEAAKL